MRLIRLTQKSLFNQKKRRIVLEERINSFKSFSEKLQIVKRLIRRNIQLGKDKKIGFPFLIIEPTDEPGTELGVKMQADLKKLKIVSNRRLNLYGDLEAVSEIPSLSECVSNK